MIQKIKEPVKGLLAQLHSAMSEKSCSELINVIESVSGSILEIQIKKVDQKKEKYLF